MVCLTWIVTVCTQAVSDSFCFPLLFLEIFYLFFVSFFLFLIEKKKGILQPQSSCFLGSQQRMKVENSGDVGRKEGQIRRERRTVL